MGIKITHPLSVLQLKVIEFTKGYLKCPYSVSDDSHLIQNSHYSSLLSFLRICRFIFHILTHISEKCKQKPPAFTGLISQGDISFQAFKIKIILNELLAQELLWHKFIVFSVNLYLCRQWQAVQVEVGL